jgi:hypothetical protein
MACTRLQGYRNHYAVCSAVKLADETIDALADAEVGLIDEGYAFASSFFSSSFFSGGL